jgi:hypothetical protein
MEAVRHEEAAEDDESEEDEGSEDELSEDEGLPIARDSSHPRTPSPLRAPSPLASPTADQANAQPSPPPASPLPSDDGDSDKEDGTYANETDAVKIKVANEVGKARARQHKKYHSKKGAGQIGRAKGSKAKHSDAVKVDSGGWF